MKRSEKYFQFAIDELRRFRAFHDIKKTAGNRTLTELEEWLMLRLFADTGGKVCDNSEKPSRGAVIVFTIKGSPEPRVGEFRDGLIHCIDSGDARAMHFDYVEEWAHSPINKNGYYERNEL